VLRFLGAVFLTAIIAACGAFGAWYYHDTQARKFLAAATPAIYTTWNVDAFLNRSLAKALALDEMTRDAPRMFYFMNQALGPLQSFEPFEGTMRYHRGDESLPRGFIGRYSTIARFERDKARVTMAVLKTEGAWRITYFNVESDAITEAIRNQGRADNARFEAGSPADREAVEAEAHEVLRYLDEARPGAAWDGASRIFQDRVPRATFVKEYEAMLAEVGERRGRKISGVGFLTNLPGHPPGEYARARFVVTYARMTLREQIVFFKENGQWSLALFDVSQVKPAP
jgi:hypothetical protein